MPRRSTSRTWFFEIAFIVFVGLLVARLVWPAKAGKLPQLEVAGWLNGPGPSPNDLAGKIVVIDCWASWCGPCIAQIPGLVELYERTKPRGVAFVGLTTESAVELPKVSAVLAANPGARWPIGYGAESTVRRLGVDAFPTYVLFDSSGQEVWRGHSHDRLEGRIVALLGDRSAD